MLTPTTSTSTSTFFNQHAFHFGLNTEEETPSATTTATAGTATAGTGAGAGAAAGAGVAGEGPTPSPVSGEINGDDLSHSFTLLRAPSALPFTKLTATTTTTAATATQETTTSSPDSAPDSAATAAPASSSTLTFPPVDAMVLLLVWRPAIEATAGLFLLGKVMTTNGRRQQNQSSLDTQKYIGHHRKRQMSTNECIHFSSKMNAGPFSR
jgi:hypothetical protein